jgi:hypothetical protein
MDLDEPRPKKPRKAFSIKETKAAAALRLLRRLA